MKVKTCKCGNEYTQYTSMQNCCIDCLAEKVAKNRIKTEKSVLQSKKREQIKEKKATKARLREMEPLGEYKKRADAVYNPYIRLRDEKAGLPCPSCKRYDHEIPYSPYGKWDCGHYLGKGAFPELRYVEINAWRQCKSCNSGSYYHAKPNKSVKDQYRITLIEWIGLEKVEWLEGPHPPAKYTREDLIEIERFYKEKLKILKESV